MSDMKQSPSIGNGAYCITLIDNILKIFDDDTMKGRFVFVVGCSGAGKTTLGENFKKVHNWIHFDCDAWSYGQDAVHESGKAIAPESLMKRSNELIEAYDKLAVEKGWLALFRGENPPLSVWTPYYSLMAKEILKVRAKYNYKDMIMTQSVYPFCVREFLRSILGKELVFIILNTSKELLTKRIIARDTKNAKTLGKTLQQYIDSFGRHTSFEQYEKQVGSRLIGFDVMRTNEPNTFQIDVNEKMTVDDVFHITQNILNV
eukprot:397116_1